MKKEMLARRTAAPGGLLCSNGCPAPMLNHQVEAAITAMPLRRSLPGNR